MVYRFMTDMTRFPPREIRDAIIISIMLDYDKNHVIAMIGLADDSKTLAEVNLSNYSVIH